MSNIVLSEALNRIKSERTGIIDKLKNIFYSRWNKTWPKTWNQIWQNDGGARRWNKTWPKQWDKIWNNN